MSAKRRAAGPAVTRKPRKPGTTRRRLRRVLKWFLIVALVGTLLLVGGFVYLYKTTPIPDPNKDFQTQTSFVYYNDGKTELGQYATQNRQIISLQRHAADSCRTPWSPPRTAPSGPTAASTPRASSARRSTTPAAVRRRARPRSPSST